MSGSPSHKNTFGGKITMADIIPRPIIQDDLPHCSKDALCYAGTCLVTGRYPDVLCAPVVAQWRRELLRLSSSTVSRTRAVEICEEAAAGFRDAAEASTSAQWRHVLFANAEGATACADWLRKE